MSTAGQTTESFVQDRVSRAALYSAGLTGTALAFRVGGNLAGRFPMLEPSMLVHAGALAVLALLFFVTRGERARGARFVRGAEAVGFVGASTLEAMMALFIPMDARPDMIVLLALTMTMVTRAIVVPSSPTRTTLLTAAAGVPILVFCALGARHIAPKPTLTAPVAIVTIAAGLWWTLTVILAALASRTIFGLRREVREARQLGQYQLVEKIGEGGMGSVYRAHHALLRRPTAIKLLPPDRNGPEDVARFEREVQLTASLSHPNTVTIFDYGRTPDGTFYYAMELLDGLNLEQIVEAGGPLPVARAIHVMRHVAAALVEAHGAGLVHRDIKPANVLLCKQGGALDVVKVVDFGLVKRLHGGDGDPAASESRVERITGTPLYLSPEAIAKPTSVGPSSDLYALGAMTYYLLTGAPPFRADTVVELCAAHLHKAPEPLEGRMSVEVPRELSALILGCLAKSTGDRPADAKALVDALAPLAARHPWTQEDAERAAVTGRADAVSGIHGRSPNTVTIDLAHR